MYSEHDRDGFIRPGVVGRIYNEHDRDGLINPTPEA